MTRGRPGRTPVRFQSDGYVILHAPTHPLANNRGDVYEHRAVLWSKTQGLPTNCHWCGCALVWGRNLEVDHLDSVKTNNAPANLVPTCHRCNMRRWMSARWGRGDWLTHPPVHLFPLAPKEVHA